MGRISCFLACSIFLLHMTLISTTETLHDEDAHKQPAESWIVQTKTGPVEGHVTTGFTNQEVYIFNGIPYAEPPLGKLRFKPPQPVQPWTEVLKPNTKSLPCYQQYNKVTFYVYEEKERLKRPWSEDCLTLKIWVPKPKVQEAPVLVVFHPGMFSHGSNDFPDGSTLAAHGQNVIASMNYRLGAFGFLNLGIPGASGSVGLLDQQLALQWIHENIHQFGGKTEAIILTGAGNAGAASAAYHVLSPKSSSYFKTSTFFGGSPTCSWAFQDRDKSLENAIALSKRLGCHENSTEAELECLLYVHPEDILDASSGSNDNILPFLPTVDGIFLTQTVKEAMKSSKQKNAIIMASNAVEGSLFFQKMNNDLKSNLEQGISIEEFRESVKRIRPDLSNAGMTFVESYYLDKCNSGDLAMIRDAAIRLYSDVLIDCCMNDFADYATENGYAVYKGIDDFTKESNPSWVGATHGLNVQIGFGYPFADTDSRQIELHISTFWMNWINEQSRKKASDIEKDVPLYNLHDKPIVYWNVSGPVPILHYREGHCELWNKIIPKLGRQKGK